MSGTGPSRDIEDTKKDRTKSGSVDFVKARLVQKWAGGSENVTTCESLAKAGEALGAVAPLVVAGDHAGLVEQRRKGGSAVNLGIV